MEYDIDSILLNLGNNNYTSQGIKKKVKGYASIKKQLKTILASAGMTEKGLFLLSRIQTQELFFVKKV